MMIRASLFMAFVTSMILLLVRVGTAEEPAQEAKKVDQPKSLRKAIEEGIGLLEANKMDEYFERFWAPGNKLAIKFAPGGWDGAKKQLKDVVQRSDLKALKEIQTQKVELSADGRDAVFALSAPIEGIGQKIGFEMVGDRWVIYHRERDLKEGEKRVEQPESLRRAVKQCIDALEANKWDDFVMVIAPDQREAIQKHGPPPKEQLAQPLKVLKELQSTSRKVVLSADGSSATFELSAESPKHTMTFKKVDGAWYISDRD
jgi:hypothetical protein